jgi:hypothetical protein
LVLLPVILDFAHDENGRAVAPCRAIALAKADQPLALAKAVEGNGRYHSAIYFGRLVLIIREELGFLRFLELQTKRNARRRFAGELPDSSRATPRPPTQYRRCGRIFPGLQ